MQSEGSSGASSSGGDDAPIASSSSDEGYDASSSDEGGSVGPHGGSGPIGEPIPICGDGYVDPGEECDGDNGGLSCTDLGFASGWLRCNNQCELDTRECDMCGNDVVDPGEQCDGDSYEGDCTCTSTCVRFGSECRPSAVVITEIFAAPLERASDNAGQWFELYNHETVARNLQGCLVVGAQHGEKFEIDQPLVMPPQGYVTIGAGERDQLGMEPGFVMPPQFLLSPDTDTIGLMCDGLLLDRVRYESEAPWPAQAPGRSIQVHHLNSSTNDTGTDWCTASAIYGIGHAGTPNQENDC